MRESRRETGAAPARVSGGGTYGYGCLRGAYRPRRKPASGGLRPRAGRDGLRWDRRAGPRVGRTAKGAFRRGVRHGAELGSVPLPPHGRRPSWVLTAEPSGNRLGPCAYGFRGEAGASRMWIWGRKPPRLRSRAGSRPLGGGGAACAPDRAVQQRRGQLRLVLQVSYPARPDALIAPAGQAAIDRAPSSKTRIARHAGLQAVHMKKRGRSPATAPRPQPVPARLNADWLGMRSAGRHSTQCHPAGHARGEPSPATARSRDTHSHRSRFRVAGAGTGRDVGGRNLGYGRGESSSSSDICKRAKSACKRASAC